MLMKIVGYESIARTLHVKCKELFHIYKRDRAWKYNVICVISQVIFSFSLLSVILKKYKNWLKYRNIENSDSCIDNLNNHTKIFWVAAIWRSVKNLHNVVYSLADTFEDAVRRCILWNYLFCKVFFFEIHECLFQLSVFDCWVTQSACRYHYNTLANLSNFSR